MTIRKGKKFISILMMLSMVCSCFTFLAFPVSATNYDRVQITTKNQIVDTLNGVPAKYIPGVNNSNTGSLCCAGYVKQYYEQIFGVTVSGLVNNGAPKTSEKGYSFKQITSGIKVGDIVRLPGHWAIVKSVSGKNLTLIEQNWKWLSSGKTYAAVNRVVTLGKSNGLVVFRLYRGNQSANDGAVNDNASKNELENLLFDYQLYGAPDLHPDLFVAFGYNESKLKAHWLEYGQSEGRIPSILFDAKWYLKQNPDVANMWGKTNYKAAYDHFVEHGFWEGRQGSPYFSAKYYLEKHPDLKAAFGNDYLAAAKHFLEYGVSANELRQASSQFSLKAYSQYNADVKKAFSKPIDRIYHYIKYVQYGHEKWRKCL